MVVPFVILLMTKLIWGVVPLWLIGAILAFMVIAPLVMRFMMKQTKEESQVLHHFKEWDFHKDHLDCNEELTEIYSEMKDYLGHLLSTMTDIKLISSNLKQSIDGVSENAAGISDISEGIATGALSQAEEVEICAQLSDELGHRIEEMNATSSGLIKETDQLGIISHDGSNNMQTMMEKNNELYEAVQGVIKQVDNLSALAIDINAITTIMKGISDQTGLLSLNASIEAARAGESGRSFAVVAEEIRKLSNDSRQSSDHIAELVQTVTDSLTGIKETINVAEDIFKDQYESVTYASDSFSKVNDFISGFIESQQSFDNTFNAFNKSKDVLISSIDVIASVASESAATTQELASLVMSQHNSLDALGDLTEMLSEHVTKVEVMSDKIQVRRQESKKKKFGVVLDSGHEFWDPLRLAAKQTAKIYNANVEILDVGDRQHAVEDQIKIIDDLIKKGYDGIAISPLNDPRVSRKLQEAEKAGLKVVFINSRVDGIYALGLYETNGVEAGKHAARVVGKMLKGKGRVIVNKWQDIHIEAIEKRAEGFLLGMKEFKEIEVVEVLVPANPSEQEALVIIEDMLRKYPQTDLFFSTNIDWATYYLAYFKRHGKKQKLVTIDFVKSLERDVRSGQIDSSISQRPFVWGEKAIKALSDATAGKDVESYADTGTFEINNKNLDVFLQRFK